MAAFSQSTIDGTPPKVDLSDAARVVNTVTAATRSLESGQPEKPDELAI